MANAQRNQHAGVFTIVLVAGIVGAGLYTWLLNSGYSLDALVLKIADNLDQIFVQSFVKFFKKILSSPVFYIVLCATLLLERLIPAQPGVKFFSASRLQDVVWFFYETVLHAAVIVTFTACIFVVYDHYFRFLTIKAVAGWPEWARFIIAVLVQDFAHYAQHWVHHKVPWLWNLHAVHHSQKELNFFTDFRYHALEYILRELFLVVPFLILGISPPVIVAFSVFRRWHTRFYHANIKTNLGPLRYILVTPQSHRVHHSFQTRHWDKNFGSLFVFWDFLFGTQYKGWDEYPATGIPDNQFPHEQKTDLKSLLIMPFKQMAYSLQVTGRQISQLFESKKKEAVNLIKEEDLNLEKK